MNDEYMWNYFLPIWVLISFLKIIMADEKAEISAEHVNPVFVKLCNKGKINLENGKTLSKQSFY